MATNQSGTILWRWEGVFGDTLPSPNGVDVTLRYPGQTYDSETGLFYNWNRYYDPGTGRYVSVDPVSVGEHVEASLNGLRTLTMPANSPVSPENTTSLAGADLMSDVPFDLNPYDYVADNSLRWTDPTGKNLPEAIMMVAGGCFLAYCTHHALSYCESKYPNHRDLLDPDSNKFSQCISQQLPLCLTLGFYVMDPIGSSAATGGEEAGKKMCKECQK